MKCPKCQAETTPSLAGWLCLSCGTVTPDRQAVTEAKKVVKRQPEAPPPANPVKE